MIIPMRAILAALLFLLAAVGSALAQPVSLPGPAEPLPGRPDVTYADLARLVMPGIGTGVGQSGDAPIVIRHIDGWDENNPRPATDSFPRVAAIPVQSDDKDRLALLLDFGDREYAAEGIVVLALFDVAGEPRLLDAANVALDRYTVFQDPVRLPVGAGNDLLITRSTHHNSGQNYVNDALILVRGDRFELVDTIFTFSVRGCAHGWTQQLDVQLGGGEPFADIVATVTELTTPPEEECRDAAAPEPKSRTITVTYSWDAATRRYIPDSDAFAVLERENEAWF